MKRVIVALVVLAGCRDQEAVCRRAVEHLAPRESWVEDCVRERWTDREIECYLRHPPGTFAGMFCRK